MARPPVGLLGCLVVRFSGRRMRVVPRSDSDGEADAVGADAAAEVVAGRDRKESICLGVMEQDREAWDR